MMDASFNFQKKTSTASLVEPLKQLENTNLMVQLIEEKSQARKIGMFKSFSIRHPVSFSPKAQTKKMVIKNVPKWELVIFGGVA